MSAKSSFGTPISLSILLIVCCVEPTFSANPVCVRCFASLSSLTLFSSHSPRSLHLFYLKRLRVIPIIEFIDTLFVVFCFSIFVDNDKIFKYQNKKRRKISFS